MQKYWVWLGLILITVCSCIGFCSGQCACTGAGGEWNAQLNVVSLGARNATIRWSLDTAATNASYVVEYKEKGIIVLPILSELINVQFDGDYTYVIVGLNPETEYEVLVYQTTSRQTCGNCANFTTIAAQEPPGPPNSVMATTSGPSILSVTWLAPLVKKDIVTSYVIDCDPVENGVNPPNTTRLTPSFVSFRDLSPNTTYECAVIARSPFGNSPAATAQVVTPPRETVPGLLLIVSSHIIEYVQLTESSLLTPSSLVDDRTTLLNFTNDEISGVDYHFNQESLYIGFVNGVIKQLNISVSKTHLGRLELSLLNNTSETIYRALSGSQIGDITVDWLNNIIYWIEFTSTKTKIMYMLIEGNESFCSVEWTDRHINHITVDPVHGYMYWSINSSDGSGGLFRASLGDLLMVNSDCPSNFPSESTIIADSLLLDFVLEPSIFIYFISSIGLQSTGFDQQNGGNLSDESIRFATSLEAFVEAIVTVTVSGGENLFRICSISAKCQSTLSFYPGESVIDISAFRKSKQPLPAPLSFPTNIRVITSSDSSYISWKRPDFVATFFGPNAFDDWLYCVNYSLSNAVSSLISNCTRHLNITLFGLQSDTLYEFTLSAIGPGGEKTTPSSFVFQTKTVGSEDANLLISTDNNVLQASLEGTSIQPVEKEERTKESNGIAYDFRNDLYFWIIEGGQGSLYRYNKTSKDTLPLRESLDRPVSLAADWVARRLFWVQDGDTVSDPRQLAYTHLSMTMENPKILVEDLRIAAIAVDSYNGLIFWISGNDIRMSTLSGLNFRKCKSINNNPIAITLDVEKQLLYWLTVNTTDNVASVSQLSYSTEGCESTSVTKRLLEIILSSSSRGVLAYGLGTLYLTTVSINSQPVYAIPANLAAIGNGLTITYWVMNFEPNVVRDIAVVSKVLQPLPDGLAESAGLDTPTAVVPLNLTYAPRLRENESNTSVITVEWGGFETNISQSVLYEIQYNLSSLKGDSMSPVKVTSDTSIIAEVPIFYTQVTVSVLPHTLWVLSDSTKALTSTFTSPPARPDQVLNVRVYVYNAVFNSNNITALVVWNPLSQVAAGGIVNQYTVNITNVQTNQHVKITQNSGNQTYLLVRYFTENLKVNANGDMIEELINTLVYPLEDNASYKVQVSASNDGGAGIPSESVIFSTNDVSPPLEILVVMTEGSQLSGTYNISYYDAVDPAAVNTVSRFIYWYNRYSKCIMMQSLDGGQPIVFVALVPITVVSMSYEWQGERLYMIGYDSSAHYEIWRVPIVHTAGIERVYQLSGGVEQVSNLVVDSFRQGAAYWLQVKSGQTLLFHLNLSNSIMETRLPHTNISTMTLDPWTGNLWVSYKDIGGVFTCNSSCDYCTEKINSTVTGPLVTSISFDERRVYWTNGTFIYYVNRSLYNVRMAYLITKNISSLISLSLGRQPQFVSCAQKDTCLAPDRDSLRDMPPHSVNVTNTTFEIWWTKPCLNRCCYNVVFSYPPVMYRFIIGMKHRQSQDPFQTHLVEDGLEANEEYEISLMFHNNYTLRTALDIRNSFFHWFEVTTKPGVPDAVSDVDVFPFGVQCIGINWTNAMDLKIRHSGSLVFFVVVTEISSNITFMINNGEQNSISFNSTYLMPEEEYKFKVFVSNMLYNSSGIANSAMTWPRVPQPVLADKSNASLTVNITLEDVHRDVVSLKIKATSRESDKEHSSSPSSVAKGTFPKTLQFTLHNLSTYTEYYISGIATYSTVRYVNRACDVTEYEGRNISLITGPGVPDAPQIDIKNDMVLWMSVNSRGSNILSYNVEAESMSTMSTSKVLPQNDNMATFSKNLRDNDLSLMTQVLYNIRVYAENRFGCSAPSNVQEFSFIAEPDPPTSLLSTAAVSGLGVGVGIFLIAVFIFAGLVLLLCYKKIQNKSRARLSIAYGPDLELTSARAHRYFRTNAANNPQYSWSRDDYVATEEELAQLHHFPRQYLALHNFLGEGEFGEVYQGTAFDILGSDTGPHPVAIKTFHKGATTEERHKFLSEAALMGKFDHPNIVKILAVCVDNDPVYIIMELMPAGDLLKFIREAHPETGPPLLTREEQLQIALDVSCGCRHLELKHFIHRDIAARNCLVSSKGADRVVKIGDFGLAKDLYSTDYYQVEGQRKLPVRWMSPEALLQGRFTIESDVWSYGVLLFEVMSLGNQPYPGLSNQEVLQFVTGGGRLERPENCPHRVYRLMLQCWKKYASDRCRFEEIYNTLENIMQDRQRESYAETDSEDETDTLNRDGSKKLPTRSPSFRIGLTNLVRTSSQKLRNSLRRHSMHRKEDQNTHTSENTGDGFRESGLI